MTQDDQIIYEIRFHGTVSPRWAAWFEGYDLIGQENGDMLLRGPVRDQAELRGVLEKIANLNLKLISVNPVDIEAPHNP
jgi:hypothetical protein